MLNFYNLNNHDSDKIASAIKNGKSKQNIFVKYNDPTNEFTSQELKLGFWYLRNKTLLYKILFFSLVGVNIILVGFSIWQWIIYILGWQNAQQVQVELASSVNYTGLHPHYSAQPIQAVNTQIFSGHGDEYDAVAELVNPNSRFLVTFDYYFIVNGTKLPAQKTFLLPGEKRPVAYLGLKDSAGAVPVIALENIEYKRISAHDVPDTTGWQAYRLNFKVSDFVFLKSLAQEGANADAVQFKLTNASPYSYADVNFYMALLQNGQMVGMLPLHLDSLKSLEVKNIDLRNFAAGLEITEIALYPIINLYDSAAYLLPQSY